VFVMQVTWLRDKAGALVDGAAGLGYTRSPCLQC
jgi:hypothetical protein